MKHQYYKLCFEKLFKITIEKRDDEIQINYELIVIERVPPPVMQKSEEVGKLKIAPVLKKDFEVQCDIKIVNP